MLKAVLTECLGRYENPGLGSVALAAIGVSIPAYAADMAVKAPPPPAPAAPYNWPGLYVGGNFGGWTSGDLNIPGNSFHGGLTEFIAGIQAGYNFQAGHLLFGVEGDFDWATFDPSDPYGCNPRLCQSALDWDGGSSCWRGGGSLACLRQVERRLGTKLRRGCAHRSLFS